MKLALSSAALLLLSLAHSLAHGALAAERKGTEWVACRIQLSPGASLPQQTAAAMLRAEVEKRTGFHWVLSNTPASSGCSIAMELNPHLEVHSQAAAPESFALKAQASGRTLKLSITGIDDRGVLFGTGFLLRHLAMQPGSIAAVGGLSSLSTEQSPVVAVRGHQLGYRPKNNTFDGWSAAQFEQYIRDLAVFGTNTIELIPPRSDDDAQSPLYTLQPLPMMQAISAILQRYGLDCSIWYPALDKDYTDPATIDRAVAEWSAVFRALPRVDAVFVPGGDPGHTAPRPLFALLEREAAALRQSHPSAQMWVSPQSFSQTWLEEFFALLAQEPRWLTGVVYGPEMRISPEEFRRRVPARYPIRFYPDITHTLAAQYPVPEWDPAFALTEGREPINPRPQDQSILFHRYALKPVSDAFVAYSEGSNDDINKVLWSAWGWDPSRSSTQILEEYGRYFISPAVTRTFAEGVAGLEQNWRGPARTNPSIRPTLQRFHAIESIVGAGVAHNNWRLQQVLYRADYDAWVQQRLNAEDKAVAAAMRLAEQAISTRSLEPLNQGKALLSATPQCATSTLCVRLQSIADDLFRSIRMQLSVPRFQALAVDRGANLDRVDAPLTDRPWLLAEIDSALASSDESTRPEVFTTLSEHLHSSLLPSVTADELVDFPGLAGKHPHLQQGSTFAEDPSGLTSTYRSATARPNGAPSPLWQMTFGGTLYDRPLTLEYTHLIPGRAYTLDVIYPDDAHELHIEANDVSVSQRCLSASHCTRATIQIAPQLLGDGKLVLTWRAAPGGGGNGRRVRISRVSLAPVTVS